MCTFQTSRLTSGLVRHWWLINLQGFSGSSQWYGWTKDSTSGNHKDKAKDNDNFRHYGANIENRCNSKTDKVNQKRGANEGFSYGLEYYENTYMCTQCTLSSVLIFCCFYLYYYKGMYFWYIWQTYPTGITKRELTNVEIQE